MKSRPSTQMWKVLRLLKRWKEIAYLFANLFKTV